MDEDTLYRIAISLAEGFLREDELTIGEMAQDLDVSEEQAQEACLRLLPMQLLEEV